MYEYAVSVVRVDSIWDSEKSRVVAARVLDILLEFSLVPTLPNEETESSHETDEFDPRVSLNGEHVKMGVSFVNVNAKITEITNPQLISDETGTIYLLNQPTRPLKLWVLLV